MRLGRSRVPGMTESGIKELFATLKAAQRVRDPATVYASGHCRGGPVYHGEAVERPRTDSEAAGAGCVFAGGSRTHGLWKFSGLKQAGCSPGAASPSLPSVL